MATVIDKSGNSNFPVDKPRACTTVISADLTAIGVSSTAPLKTGSITVGGTFVGSVNLERQDNAGNWISVQTFTAPGVVTLADVSSRPTRFNCTAFTSGTIHCEAAA